MSIPSYRSKFFGRRKGKALSKQQTALLENLLPSLTLQTGGSACPHELAALFDTQVEEIRCEIGFGGGEHLLHQMQQNKNIGFIGAEPFINGVAKLLSKASGFGQDSLALLQRLRLYVDDAAPLLDWLPENSLSSIYLLYPDPWPKKKHCKRRFIQPENINRMARVLRDGGLFYFASDIADYVNWTLQHFHNNAHFRWCAREAKDWQSPFPNWIKTRYESKALATNRRPAYLTFQCQKQAS